MAEYSPAYNSQKAEATKMFINGWVNKQNVIYEYNGILLSFKKEGNCDTCYNINELWGHNAKWNKPVPKRQILNAFTYLSYLGIIKPIETKNDGYQGQEGEMESCCLMVWKSSVDWLHNNVMYLTLLNCILENTHKIRFIITSIFKYTVQ